MAKTLDWRYNTEIDNMLARLESRGSSKAGDEVHTHAPKHFKVVGIGSRGATRAIEFAVDRTLSDYFASRHIFADHDSLVTGQFSDDDRTDVYMLGANLLVLGTKDSNLLSHGKPIHKATPKELADFIDQYAVRALDSSPRQGPLTVALMYHTEQETPKSIEGALEQSMHPDFVTIQPFTEEGFTIVAETVINSLESNLRYNQLADLPQNL